jgi:plasmid segregation protein ParM
LIDNRRGFAGSIAEVEDEWGNGATYGDSKAHADTKVRVLLAIHRYMEKYCPNATTFCIVVGQPVISHIEKEKEKIIKMLKGRHEFTVNGIKRNIWIADLRVTTEGGGGFWSNPQNGMCRIIDAGSGTINLVSILNNKHIVKSSTTMNIGTETMQNKNDLDGMARGIIQAATKLKWKKDDTVLICGGVANVILPHIQKHFIGSDTIKPLLKREYDVISSQPVYANAIGFYNLANSGVFNQ